MRLCRQVAEVCRVSKDEHNRTEDEINQAYSEAGPEEEMPGQN